MFKIHQKLQHKNMHIIFRTTEICGSTQSCLLVCETVKSGKWAPSTRRNILENYFKKIAYAEFSSEILVAVYRTSRCHTRDESIMYLHVHINLRLYIAYVTIHNSHLRIMHILEANCAKMWQEKESRKIWCTQQLTVQTRLQPTTY